jgi:gliding motility-associated-like protein
VSSTPSSCATPDGTATVVANGGNGPFTYAWSPSGGNADVATGLASGDYTVTVTDASLCEASTSVTVGVSDGPVIAVESTVDASCNGGSNGSAEISVTGGTGNYTYSWGPSGGSAAAATDLSSGDYTVTVEDEAGCIATENITIGEPDALSVTADIVNTTCSGDDGSISLTVTGGTANYSYEWQPNGETTSTITGNAGSYNVTVTDANNCEITEAYTIGLTDNLQATVDPEITTIEGGESVDVVVTIDPDVANVTYTWTPTEGLSCSDCPNPTASPSETTTYEVVVIADNGCNDTAQVTIIVTTPCGDIFMPTIFSPNADGLNDELCLLGNCITELDLKIYDRWGELVFETTDPSICWDGSFRGKPMNSAVFVYKLLVRTTDGQEVEESGNVNLVR